VRPLLIINHGETTARNTETECLPVPEGAGSFVKISTLHKGEKKYLKKENKSGDIFVPTLHDFKEETTFTLDMKTFLADGMKVR